MSNRVFSNTCCNLFQNFAGVNKYNIKLLKRNGSPNMPLIQKAAVDGPCTSGKVRSKELTVLCSLSNFTFYSILFQLFLDIRLQIHIKKIQQTCVTLIIF